MSRSFRKNLSMILTCVTAVAGNYQWVMAAPTANQEFIGQTNYDTQMATGQGLEVVPLTEEDNILIIDNFNDVAVGQVPGGYEVTRETGDKTVEGNPVKVVYRGQDKEDRCVYIGQIDGMIEGEEKGKIQFTKNFDVQTDVITLSFDFSMESIKSDTVISLLDEDNNEAIRLEMRGTSLAYRYKDSLGKSTDVSISKVMTPETWMNVKIVAHVKENTVDIYVDGELAQLALPFYNYNMGKIVESLAGFRTVTPKTKVVGHYIDNLSVKIGDTALADIEAEKGEREEEEQGLIAFPGAEGGGRLASGGRGQEVYIVTTLEDYVPKVDTPIPGSLRDALSQDNRTIVFNISGTIQLKARLDFSKRKNITIAGQTAPGEGITVAGFETVMNNTNNMIIRYLRFRPGSDHLVDGGDSMDALWGRDVTNVMIDHISTSWSTDETLTIYRAQDTTVQWSITNESLAMSGHTKGRHGYGMIAGGENVTYHHNLIANHTSRNPRLGGGTPGASDIDHVGHFDFRNNVIYNWGFNGCYGGGFSESNFINNYLKPGPGTRDNVKNRVIDAGEAGKYGAFYVDGNYVDGNPEVSADNSKGIYIADVAKDDTVILTEPLEISGNTKSALGLQTAEEAYEDILAKVGATYPKRDALDARVIQEVKDGTGRYANKNAEVGGFPVTTSEVRSGDFDTDCDGMADAWEALNGLNPDNPEDGKELALDGSGYTNLENYLNSLVDMDYAPSNPTVSLVTPTMNQNYILGETVMVEVDVKDDEGIQKVDLYNGDQIIATKTAGPYIFEIDGLEDATYFISAKATDVEGNQTQSTAALIHVNEAFESKEWQHQDVGNPEAEGSASVDADGTITVKGAGKLLGTADSAHFIYKVLKGDGEIIAKLTEVTLVDHHVFSGLMIRESLDADAATVALGLSATKAYEYKVYNPDKNKDETFYRNPWGIYLAGRNTKGGSFSELDENLDSDAAALASGVSLQKDVAFRNLTNTINLGYYLKLVRQGDIFTAYSSADGEDWYTVGERTVPMGEEVYIGLAADGNQVANDIHNVNTARFIDVATSGEIIVPEIDDIDKPDNGTDKPDDNDDEDSGSAAPSGGGGGGSNTTTEVKTFKEYYNTMTTSQKESIHKVFNDYTPYTTFEEKLSLEQLKVLTNRVFTDAQLNELQKDLSLLDTVDLKLNWNVIALEKVERVSFKDITAKHWAYEGIHEFAKLGIIKGYTDGTFKGNVQLTVADAFTLLDRTLLLNNNNELKLPRTTVEKYITDKAHWSYLNIASISSKLEETTLKKVASFGNKPLSREVIAQVLYEVTNGNLKKVNETIAYTDIADSDYKIAIEYCVATGLLNGTTDKTMSPQKAVTRAEMVTILNRLNTLLK